HFHFTRSHFPIAFWGYYDKCPTVCVTRWWAGRDKAILPEPTPSYEKCLKTRRLPPVGCTLCWAHLNLNELLVLLVLLSIVT
ncbi:MAG TPA: hypothetical protein V6D19_03600, partial [Stenomitos sp.]